MAGGAGPGGDGGAGGGGAAEELLAARPPIANGVSAGVEPRTWKRQFDPFDAAHAWIVTCPWQRCGSVDGCEWFFF